MDISEEVKHTHKKSPNTSIHYQEQKTLDNGYEKFGLRKISIIFNLIVCLGISKWVTQLNLTHNQMSLNELGQPITHLI